MNTIPYLTANFQYISPLRAARAGIFLEYLKKELCSVFVDKKLYDHWSDKGWAKEDVENAINDLATQQIISVSPFQNGEISMGLFEPEDLIRINGGAL